MFCDHGRGPCAGGCGSARGPSEARWSACSTSPQVSPPARENAGDSFGACALPHQAYDPHRLPAPEGEMADASAETQQVAAGAAAQPATAPVPMADGGEPPGARQTEVENALTVLQREAGLTEDTLRVLRKAVSDNAGTREVPDEAAGGVRKRPFKPSSSKRQQLTAEEAAEVKSCVALRQQKALPDASFPTIACSHCMVNFLALAVSLTASTCADLQAAAAAWQGRYIAARKHVALQGCSAQVWCDAQDHPRCVERALVG